MPESKSKRKRNPEQNRAAVARHRAKQKQELIDHAMDGIIIRVEHDPETGRGTVTWDMDADAHAIVAAAALGLGQTVDEFLDAHFRRTLAHVKELRERKG